jgi:hypothetical protein
LPEQELDRSKDASNASGEGLGNSNRFRARDITTVQISGAYKGRNKRLVQQLREHRFRQTQTAEHHQRRHKEPHGFAPPTILDTAMPETIPCVG